MKIKNLKLENYGRFEHLDIDFATQDEHASNVTVIVGYNGAGKSQILQALAMCLSWFIVRFKNDTAEGKHISQLAINNSSSKAVVGLKVEDSILTRNKGNWESKDITASWTLYALNERKTQPALTSFQPNHLHFIIDSYRHLFSQDVNTNLPIIAFYPVNRDFVSNSMDVYKDFFMNQMTTYKDALENSINFEDFFLWYRQREDVENEQRASVNSVINQMIIDQKALLHPLYETTNKHSDEENVRKQDSTKSNFELLKEIQVEIHDNVRKLNTIKTTLDKERKSLKSVRFAIERFTGLSHLRIRRQGTPTMIVERDGEELDVNQLSQGEKSLLALVGDIARRLAILNPSLENPLHGEGMVMIDEVDLHLHPKWQHDLIDKLVKTFPNVQFILTTHSPHVISDNPNTLVYALDDGELSQVPNVYGEDVNTILTKVFDVDIRDSEVEKRFNDIRRAISHKDFLQAETKINELSDDLPSDNLELLKVRLMLAHEKLADKKNDEPTHANN